MKEPTLTQLSAEQFDGGVEVSGPPSYRLADTAPDGGPAKRTVKAPFTKIPSYRDLEFRAYLLDGYGRLLGSGVKTNIDWNSAKKEIPIDILPNPEKARLLGTESVVNVADGLVIKGIELEVATGVPDDCPGVSAVRITISGPAYANGADVAEIASFKAPQLRSYFWKPSNASGSYDPNKLVASGDQPTAFTLKTTVYDTFGREVAYDTLDLSYVDGATVNIGLGSED